MKLHQLWHRAAVSERLCRTSVMRPMSLQKLLQSNSDEESSLIKTAEWVREELTIRLAYRLFDFHRLPYIVLSNPYINQSFNIHASTFDTLLKIPPIQNSEDKQSFIATIGDERRAHDSTVDLMGMGIRQLKLVCTDIRLDHFLERFFFFRIGRRTLIDHLIAMENPQVGWAGCINLHCRPVDIIETVISSVRQSCHVSYGIAPQVRIAGNLETSFPFIPDHLAIIVTEILKNAMRATVEFYTIQNSVIEEYAQRLVVDESDLPEVNVEVYKGKEDVVIKISDKGGGIPPNRLRDIFSFGFSSVRESQEKLVTQNANSWIRSDMAGYGFGVPLSRVFARYFGGEIHIQPCFGVGTDVFVTLNHMGDRDEPLFCYSQQSNFKDSFNIRSVLTSDGSVTSYIQS